MKRTGINPPANIKICESCEQNPSAIFCFQCNGHLCASCDQQLHNNKLTRSHSRVPDSADFQPITCSVHPKSYVNCLCASCQQLICINCLVNEMHRGHVIQQLPQAFDIVQNEFNETLKVVGDRLSQLESMKMSLDKQVQQLRDSCQSVLDSTNDNFQIIIAQLQAKQQQINDQINGFLQEHLQDYNQKLEVISETRDLLANSRKGLMKQMESVMSLDSANEQLYMSRLAQHIQYFIGNYDNIQQSIDGKNNQLIQIVQQIEGELAVPQEFCLDFQSVQKFIDAIEGLYLVVNGLGGAEQQ